MSVFRALSFVLLAALPSAAQAGLVVAGNILVMDADTYTIREYTTGGALVQSFSVAPNGAIPEAARDLTVDAANNIHVYNGTFSPNLTTIDQATGSQATHTGVGFSTANTSGYGGIASVGSNVFVTDHNTFGSPSYGIVAFDTAAGYASSRFATDFSPIDLTVGLDGRLYALGNESSQASTTPDKINVYDPTTLARVEQISLPSATRLLGLRGLVADSTGQFFAVAFGDNVYRLDSSGTVVGQHSVSATTQRLYDIDLNSQGTLLAAGDDGHVFVLDSAFTTESSFLASTSADVRREMFVSFAAPIAAVPEPSSLALLGSSVGLLALLRRRKATRSATLEATDE